MNFNSDFTLDIFILGSSGFAKEIAAYIKEFMPNVRVEFVDDTSKNAITVDEYVNKTTDNNRCATILGSGHPKNKNRMLSQINTDLLNILHPRSVISKSAEIGNGCVIAPGAVISPWAIIGDNVLVNYNATIGHNSIIGNLSTISPNSAVGGWVQIGNGVYVGSGAHIHERIKIGDESIVGMGAVVLKDVPPKHIAVGIPAKLSTIEEWNSRKEKRNG